MEHGEIARRVKERYPQYSHIADNKLADLVLAKYPQYATAEVEEPEVPEVPSGVSDPNHPENFASDPNTWQPPTPEEEQIHRVGADPNAGFGQNLVEPMFTSDPNTWQPPTPEQEQIHRVGADPNAG